MPEAQTQKSTGASAPVPFKKAAPTTVREARVGSVFVRLKKWSNGEHSIELSQRDRKNDTVFHQITVGEFESTGLCDAISALRSAATA